MWSEILPRLQWPVAKNHMATERVRRLMNTRVSHFVRDRGGVVVRHKKLEGISQGLMCPDRVHLDIRLYIFLSGLQDYISEALLHLGGGRSSV